jgi:SPP1 gp7 family putative phage head morphogenesis protein
MAAKETAKQIRALTGLKKQARINETRFNKLMLDIRRDVVRATENSNNLNQWLAKLKGINTGNMLVEGPYAKQMQTVLTGIVNGANYSTLPRGASMEIVKGVISENTMHYVTRMSKDMQRDLRKIALEGYNNKLGPQGLAKELSKRVTTINEQRAKVIARTETRRASSLANYTNAKQNMGAQSFFVKCDPAACPRCVEVYDFGNIVFDISDNSILPPFHPNCRCVAYYSTKPVEVLQSMAMAAMASNPAALINALI